MCFGAFDPPAGGAITDVTNWADTASDSQFNYIKWLQQRNIEKIAASREVFSSIELFREGVFGTTRVFQGVITDCDLVIHFKPILDMFAEEARTGDVNTGAISNAFFELTTVTVSQQSLVPSAQLWKTLQDSASASGGKANLPSYPIKVEDVYNGPRSFPAASRTLLLAITGSDVPDKISVVMRAARNSGTKTGSTCYFELPDVRSLALSVATQGRLAFQDDGTSPFSDASNGITCLTDFNTVTTEAQKARKRRFFADTVLIMGIIHTPLIYSCTE